MEKISTFTYSDRGGREYNEDSVACEFQNGNLVAVLADGLGGMGDGGTASQQAIRTLLACGGGTFPTPENVTEYMNAANTDIRKLQKNEIHMKTTAVYLCLRGSRAIWAHIGDSRLYHFYNGALTDFTLDHSVPQMAVLMGDITREQIPQHPGRSRLLRCLGSEDMKADVHGEVALKPGKHAFLLCTDGVWEYIREQEFTDQLHTASDAQQWISALRTLVQKRSPADHDNNSAVGIMMEV